MYRKEKININIFYDDSGSSILDVLKLDFKDFFKDYLKKYIL